MHFAWIHKSVEIATGCRTSHKNTKHIDYKARMSATPDMHQLGEVLTGSIPSSNYEKTSCCWYCVVWLRAGRPGDRSSISGRGKRIFPLDSVSRPVLGPSQPPVQWVPWFLSSGLKRVRDVTLTTHPHLVPGSRMSRRYICPKRLRGV
jgi:hypothetical protein